MVGVGGRNTEKEVITRDAGERRGLVCCNTQQRVCYKIRVTDDDGVEIYFSFQGFVLKEKKNIFFFNENLRNL